MFGHVSGPAPQKRGSNHLDEGKVRKRFSPIRERPERVLCTSEDEQPSTSGLCLPRVGLPSSRHPKQKRKSAIRVRPPDPVPDYYFSTSSSDSDSSDFEMQLPRHRLSRYFDESSDSEDTIEVVDDEPGGAVGGLRRSMRGVNTSENFTKKGGKPKNSKRSSEAHASNVAQVAGGAANDHTYQMRVNSEESDTPSWNNADNIERRSAASGSRRHSQEGVSGHAERRRGRRYKWASLPPDLQLDTSSDDSESDIEVVAVRSDM